MGKGKKKGRSQKAKNRIKAIKGTGKIDKPTRRGGGGRFKSRGNSFGPEEDGPHKFPRGGPSDAGPGGQPLGENQVEWAHHEPEILKEAPHSFIIGRGKVGRFLRELKMDIRKVMEPYTASKLKEREGNNVRDYVSIASYFHVSHLLVLTRTAISPYLKICKIPRGPSLTFRILEYSLARDVLSSLKRIVTYPMQYHHHPLLVMNNFTDNGSPEDTQRALDLVTTTFQNMFPSINVTKTNVREIRRVLMLNYNSEDDTIDFRHYTITYKPTGVSKSIKKLLLSSKYKIPNLNKNNDIAEYLLKKRESEAESDAEGTAEAIGLTKLVNSPSSEIEVRLVELGPRMKLQLMKVEEGLLDGEILYHKVVRKTEEEKIAIRKHRAQKMREKEQRRRIQERNVKKKLEAKSQKKKRSRRYDKDQNYQDDGPDDDDRGYYRSEVGQDPDDMFD